jgi:hypothetical protein
MNGGIHGARKFKLSSCVAYVNQLKAKVISANTFAKIMAVLWEVNIGDCAGGGSVTA